jgi:uncharacterized membrane protein
MSEVPSEVVADETAPGGGPSRFRKLLLSPWPPLFVLIAAFAAVFTYFAFERLASFNASIDDLGWFNQVYWVTTHGGPLTWATSSQKNFHATYPWQEATLWVVVPAYALFPGPQTLLVAQSIVVPLAAIPVYLLARQYGTGPWTAFGFSALYLLNYQVESGVLNDFHVQAFFPLAFFAMVLAYERRARVVFVAFAILAMLVNPLTLLVVLAFLIGQLVRIAGSPFALRKIVATLSRWVRGPSVEVVVFALCIAALLLETLVGEVSGYHLTETTTVGSSGPYSSTVATRLIYLGMTFLPFLGAVMLSWETLITAVPLFGYLAVGNAKVFQFFGTQDAFTFLTVALWGLLVFTRNYCLSRPALVGRPEPRPRVSSPTARLHPYRVAAPLIACLLISSGLFLSFSPISPVNDQPGYLTRVNENPSQILDVTPADHFLQQTIALVPENASVLTQNNIVQLSGRGDFNWAYPTKPGPIDPLNYSVIVADDSDEHSAQYWYSFLRPYVITAVDSGEYGVFSLGYGILGLERGFSGPPLLAGPMAYNARSLPLFSGEYVGSVAVHPAGSDFAFWYGPYVDLPPGNYSATFQLRVTNVTSPTDPILRLQVCNWTSTGLSSFAEDNLTFHSFGLRDDWVNISVPFHLWEETADIQFAGYFPTSVATIYFAGVTVTFQSNV